MNESTGEDKQQTLLEIIVEIMNLLQCEKTPSDNNTAKLITGKIMGCIVLVKPFSVLQT